VLLLAAELRRGGLRGRGLGGGCDGEVPGRLWKVSCGSSMRQGGGCYRRRGQLLSSQLALAGEGADDTEAIACGFGVEVELDWIGWRLCQRN